MRLEAAARRFDKTVCRDGYTGRTLFSGQLTPFDDAKRDAEVSDRRILSVSKDITMPARRVIEAAGLKYVVGGGTPDQFNGRTIRVGYVLHVADTLGRVMTQEDACLNLPGRSVWAGRAWLKYLAYTDQDSKLPRQNHIDVAASEDVSTGHIIQLGDRWFFVRNSDVSTSGIRVCLADDIGAPSPGVLKSETLNRVLETKSTTSTDVNVLVVRWQSLYSYQTIESPSYGPGDAVLIIAASQATPKAGMVVESQGRRWSVYSTQQVGGVHHVWGKHLG